MNMPKHDLPICTLPLPGTQSLVVITTLRAAAYLALAEQAMRSQQAPDERVGPEWIDRGQQLYDLLMRSARYDAKRLNNTRGSS